MNKISYDPKNWDEVCRLLGAYMDTCLTPEEIEKQKDEVEFLFCSLENCWKALCEQYEAKPTDEKRCELNTIRKVTNELRRSWNCKSKEASWKNGLLSSKNNERISSFYIRAFMSFRRRSTLFRLRREIQSYLKKTMQQTK